MYDDPSGYLTMPPSVESPTAGLYAQDDLRRDLLHRNTLSIMTPDANQWPGINGSFLSFSVHDKFYS